MQPKPTERIVIKDYPIALWVVGAVLTLSGLFWEAVFLTLQPGGLWPAGRDLLRPGNPFYMIVTGGVIPGAVLFLIGAPMTLLTAALTVTADRLSGRLTMRYRSLLRVTIKEYALTEVAGVEVDSSHSSSSEGSSTTYNIVLVLGSGQRVPWRSYSSSGYNAKEAKARQLREFLGLPESSWRRTSGFQALQQLANPSFAPGQEGVTDGVTWRLEKSQFGGMPVSRWASSDFKLPDAFVCLMQRPPDHRAAQGGRGLVGKVSQMLYHQMLSFYGIAAERLPGFDSATAVEALDVRLAPAFASLTNDQASARQCLNPWAVMPLAQWVDQHPMKTIQTAGQAGQLVVLFSPDGVSLTGLNATTSDEVEAVTRLGVDLVRAQGAG